MGRVSVDVWLAPAMERIFLLGFITLNAVTICSMNIGPVHLVSFSSEYYYYVEYGWQQIIHQYEWLERDLIVSNTVLPIVYAGFALL